MVVLSNSAPMVTTRVLYIGSAVPLETTTGVEAVQAPLRERYPVDDDSNIEGIDANISITNSCIQMQYINDADSIVQFPISSLTQCAAVRCISTTNSATGEKGASFVALNDPLAGGENSTRPAIFTAITRRTKGRKVLECHGFICASPRDALNLVKCASIAGNNYKKNGSVKQPPKPTTVISAKNGTVHATVDHDPFLDIGVNPANRISTDSSILATSTLNKSSTLQNGGGNTNGPPMRLVPAEPIAQVAAGPEFFEPVSKQGYFYTSEKAEVKKYNIEKLRRNDDKENITTPVQPTVENGTLPPTASVVNGYRSAPAPRQVPERTTVGGPPPPIYVRLPRNYGPAAAPPPPPLRPMHIYGPPPPPHFMYARPRFFSPPPPRLRPQPFMMPPGAPPPMTGAPIFVRRPRPPSGGSRSRSPSTDSQRSRKSRSKTPTPGDANGINETERKRIPNADESSDESIRHADRARPSTPPTDYDDRRKGERMSRRDAYEVKYGVRPSARYGPPPDLVPPYGYDYYVYPPRHGGYAPFPMFNPHARARSLPNDDRYGSRSPKRKGKKSKKSKKNKSKKSKQPTYAQGPRDVYPRQTRADKRSDVSTDSYGGYHSEIPLRATRPTETTGEYQFYPPRDFRRNENQFMNERHFSKTFAETSRQSRDFDSKPYPTAYELNDALNKSRPEDPDFTMY